MSEELGYIGYFQLDNLIRSRVPFLLLNLGTDIRSWYSSVSGLHLENHSVLCQNWADVEREINERSLPLHYAFVALSEDGLQAEKLAREMQDKGFANVYVIQGGLQKMLREKKESPS